MKNFALIGVSDYIVPRHLKAIKDMDNNLLAALDKFDSVEFMDSYFPDADFFVEPERFYRYIEMLKYDKSMELDYISIFVRQTIYTILILGWNIAEEQMRSVKTLSPKQLEFRCAAKNGERIRSTCLEYFAIKIASNYYRLKSKGRCSSKG
jgi:hypothetical protein